eukprot:jgi/Mesen1/2593/ME000164S01717
MANRQPPHGSRIQAVSGVEEGHKQPIWDHDDVEAQPESPTNLQRDTSSNRLHAHQFSFDVGTGPVHYPSPHHSGSLGGSVNGRSSARNGDGDQAGRHTALIVDDSVAEETSVGLRLSSDMAITIKFLDVKYKVLLKPQRASWWKPQVKRSKVVEKEILHGVSGFVQPGEVLAMMGPSGSGKTTFLNILGGRTGKNVTGSVTYNDINYTKALKRKIGFVTQDDLFFPHLTVRETLMYAALLRLPKDLSRAQKIRRADDTIEELGLMRCKNTIIGGQFLRGISGGERKRVSIGHEILIDPSVLLLDEPTSGLDSTTALRIVQLLHRLALSGRTVVTTIHQPSSRLFHSFDKLLLLAEGHSIFFGKASLAMPYFDSVGFRPQFAVNPADFLLDLANGTTQDISLPPELASQDAKWNDKPMPEQQSDVKQFLTRSHQQLMEPIVRKEVEGLPVASQELRNNILQKRQWSATWLQQFSVLWTRGLKERWHEYLSWLRFVIALALICGCLWFDSKLYSPTDVQDQVGFLFFLAIFWGFFPLFTAVFTFPQERAILAKERASDMYQLSSYFMSRTLSDVPLEFVLPVIFLLIAYFMANLRSDAGIFILTLLAIFLNISGLGLFMGAAVMDVKKATTLASVVLLTFMLAGGYYLQSIPVFIKWVKYLSFNYYAYKLVMKVQYDPEQTYNCGPGSQMCSIQEAPSLRNVNLSDSAWNDAWPLLIMLVGWRVCAYFALRRMKTGVF